MIVIICRIIVQESTSNYDYFRQADWKTNPNAAKLWKSNRVVPKTLVEIGNMLTESSNVVYFGPQFATKYHFQANQCVFGSAPDARAYFEVSNSMALQKGGLITLTDFYLKFYVFGNV